MFLAELSFNCPCEAAPTSFLLPEIQNFNGTAIQVSDNEIDACVGDSFCISAAAINTDPEVSVLIESDFESLLPGGEFSAQEGNAASAELCLETTSEMVGTTVITLSAGPSECPGFSGDQVEIILNVSPEVELLTDDAVICAGDELPAVASGAETYVWTPLEGDMSSISGDGAEQVLSPDVTTTYVVSSPDVNPACDAADTLLVEVSLSEIELDVSNESCIGDDGEISVSVSGGGGPFVFEWDELDSSDPSVTDLGDGTYGLTVSDVSLPGCSIDTLIFVDGFIQASAALNAGDLLCAGESSLVEMVISGAGPFEVGYSIGEEASVASGVNSSVELVVTPLSNTEVCLNDITDVNGCVTMIDTCVSLDVIENAVAAFDWEPNPLSNIYSEVQFTNLSSGASDFQWSFSELGSSEEASPVVDLSPLSSCAFEACLFASNEGLCADSVCHVIPVALDAPVYMPNVFTPNNDGVNELFLPVFADEQCIDEMTFRVWNRWGEKIFETNTPGDGWNGSYKQGKYYVSDGVYIWELLYRPLSSAEQERLTGTVSVLR